MIFAVRPELRFEMNARASRIILRFCGALSWLYAVAGIAFLLGSLLVVPQAANLDLQAIQAVMAEMPSHEPLGAEPIDAARVREIFASSSFWRFFYSFLTVGFAFNVTLAIAGCALWRGGPIATIPFFALMALLALHWYVVPKWLPWDPTSGLAFGAAWGVGNVGIAPVAFTFFWLWGSGLVILGVLLAADQPSGAEPIDAMDSR